MKKTLKDACLRTGESAVSVSMLLLGMYMWGKLLTPPEIVAFLLISWGIGLVGVALELRGW